MDWGVLLAVDDKFTTVEIIFHIYIHNKNILNIFYTLNVKSISCYFFFNIFNFLEVINCFAKISLFIRLLVFLF